MATAQYSVDYGRPTPSPQRTNNVSGGISTDIVLVGLLTYQWHHETGFWNESRVTHEWILRKFPKHELLGSRILEDNTIEPAWRNVICLEDVPWLRDHKVIDDIVFPAAGYIAMAGEALRQLTGPEYYTLRNVSTKTALVLQETKTVELMTGLRPLRLTTLVPLQTQAAKRSGYRRTKGILE